MNATDDTTSGVSPAQALKLYETGDAMLLDVREPDEWAKGHAPGAIHLPLGDLDPAALDTGKLIIAICRSGNRSGKATAQLRNAGVQVRNMSGGMTAWQEDGLPIVADAGTPGTVG